MPFLDWHVKKKVHIHFMDASLVEFAENSYSAESNIILHNHQTSNTLLVPSMVMTIHIMSALFAFAQ